MQEGNYILYTESKGSGQTIVLIPGMLATTKFWKKLAAKLAQKFKVISLDLLGFGRSPMPSDCNYTKENHLSAIKNTLDHLGVNGPFVLIGHSMGALIALSYAVKFPKQVRQLILLSPPIFLTHQEAKENIISHSALPKVLLYGPLAQVTCKVFCNLLRPLTALGVAYYFKDLPSDIAKDTLLHTFSSYSKTLKNIVEMQDPIYGIKQLKIPAKIIYGSKDKRIIAKNIERLKEFSNIEVVKLEGLGHQFPLTHPEKIILNIV